MDTRIFQLSALAFHMAVIAPAFADIVPGSPLGYTGYLNEFTLMDNVVSSKPIIDIRRAQNIMQRRDASCDIIYKNVFGGSTRKVSTEEVYGATKFCRNEFYQGCLKDYRAQDPLFADKILPYFQGAMSVDLVTNSYFGDVDRIVPVNNQFSTNIFDGVFKWLKRYTTAGVIPAAQTLAITDGYDFIGTPANAYNLLDSMYHKMPPMMRTFTKAQLAFYVSFEIIEGYKKYLTAISATAGNIVPTTNGQPDRIFFNGVEVIEQPLWTPVITEIKGSAGYAAVLTVRGNFIFATDRTYGEGEDGTTALEVWYEKKDMTWYYRLFLKAGTQVALPEMVVYAATSWT